MPAISRFFGILITMYYNDHLPPHFHVRYGAANAQVGIETLAIVEGELPRRVLALVLEWASQHRDELRANWALARASQPLNPIEPLD